MIKKVFFLLFFAVGLSGVAKAQVTIGSDAVPNTNALLDLKQNAAGTSLKGLLLPRVELNGGTTVGLGTPPAHVQGMTVYNTANILDVTPGYYYNDGTKWIRITIPEFFYSPSIVLPVNITDPEYSAATETFTVDLYGIYADQFGMTDLTKSFKSPSATKLPVFTKDALEYFIIYYDNQVFNIVSLDDNGVLKYKLVANADITEKTYMNIVIKSK